MKILLGMAVLSSLVGCMTIPPDRMPITTEKREFIYDYTVEGKSQADLYRAARNYLATVYGDSRAVTRVEDEAQGTIIGKAIAPWGLSTDIAMVPSVPCGNRYDITFIAKEGRARLQLVLKEGAALPLSCAGWTLPPKRDYHQITSQFQSVSIGLGEALRGASKLDTLKNF